MHGGFSYVVKYGTFPLLFHHLTVQVSLQLPVENNFAMVVHTKAAGRTTVKVSVRCANSSPGQFEGTLLELSDEVQLLVRPQT